MATYLLRLLPRSWRQDALATALAEAFGAPLDRFRTAIETLDRYVEPARSPADFLDWLMQLVALPQIDGLTVARKRALIPLAWKTWSDKGRRATIEAWVQALTGIDAEVRNLNTVAFVPGISKAGDICGPGELALKWEVRIPQNSIPPHELRNLLTPIAADFGLYRITTITGTVLDDFA